MMYEETHLRRHGADGGGKRGNLPILPTSDRAPSKTDPAIRGDFGVPKNGNIGLEF